MMPAHFRFSSGSFVIGLARRTLARDVWLQRADSALVAMTPPLVVY